MTAGSTQRVLEASAAALAAKFPDLLVEAHHVAQTVSHGIHGRRRSGPGDTFWQFRQFEQSDARVAIDWRRSAASDNFFVREREWESAHSVWIWVNLSSSMQFQSHLAHCSKAERAIVLGLAMGDLLSRGGERIGYLGHRLWAGRLAAQRLAETVFGEIKRGRLEASSPPDVEVSRYSECILLGDFLEPIDELMPRLERIAGQGVRAHLVQVLDPAEETLPYEGHTQFVASEGEDSVIAGRAESLREAYRDRILSHRRALQALTDRLGWSFLLHHSDRTPENALLALHNRLSGAEGDYRFRAVSSVARDKGDARAIGT